MSITKFLVKILVCIIAVVGTLGIVRDIQYKNIKNEFPSSFTDKEIANILVLEVEVKEKLSTITMVDMGDEEKEAIRDEVSFVLAGVLYDIEKRQVIENSDLSKAVEKVKKIAVNNGLELKLMDKFKIVCKIYKNINDATAEQIIKKYGITDES